MIRFHELHRNDASYFETMIKYCREMFHCSVEEITSLVGKLLAGENSDVRAHVIYVECLGEMAGFAIFYYFPKSKVGFLEALVIFDDFRDQGIGGLLYWQMVDYLRRNYPDCKGHLLEMCQEKSNHAKRKAFFLRQGCIPLALDFFETEEVINKAGMTILYHPYRLDQEYSMDTIEDIFKEMSTGLLH